MYKYSIIMPVYNTGSRLNKSIASILEQSYKNWELIIIDDGSKDDSLKIAKKFAKQNKNVKVFHQDNAGPGAARNFGIKKAQGDFIAFLDSDDYYDENFLEIIDNELKNNNVDVIFYSNVKELENGKIIGGTNLVKYQNCSKEQIIKMQLMGVIPWGATLKTVKASIVKECSFSKIPVGEELIYSFNVLTKSKDFKILDNSLYHYIHTEDGQHTKGGYDPWRLVVDEVYKYLNETKKYKQYEKELNGLAMKALSIAIYRYYCNFNFRIAKKHIKRIIMEYKNKYNINNIEKDIMDKSSIIILTLINWRAYFILYLASKYKSLKK